MDSVAAHPRSDVVSVASPEGGFEDTSPVSARWAARESLGCGVASLHESLERSLAEAYARAGEETLSAEDTGGSHEHGSETA